MPTFSDPDPKTQVEVLETKIEQLNQEMEKLKLESTQIKHEIAGLKNEIHVLYQTIVNSKDLSADQRSKILSEVGNKKHEFNHKSVELTEKKDRYTRIRAIRLGVVRQLQHVRDLLGPTQKKSEKLKWRPTEVNLIASLRELNEISVNLNRLIKETTLGLYPHEVKEINKEINELKRLQSHLLMDIQTGLGLNFNTLKAAIQMAKFEPRDDKLQALLRQIGISEQALAVDSSLAIRRMNQQPNVTGQVTLMESAPTRLHDYQASAIAPSVLKQPSQNQNVPQVNIASQAAQTVQEESPQAQPVPVQRPIRSQPRPGLSHVQFKEEQYQELPEHQTQGEVTASPIEISKKPSPTSSNRIRKFRDEVQKVQAEHGEKMEDPTVQQSGPLSNGKN